MKHPNPQTALFLRNALALAVFWSVSLNAQTITNGAYTTNSLALGATNVYTFLGSPGDQVILRMGATSFNPRIELYNPIGAMIAAAFSGTSGGRDASSPETTLTNSGLFTVRVASHFNGGAGFYRVTLAKAPGDFVVSPGDQGGTLLNGFQHNGVMDVGDLDLWSFSASAGDSVVLRSGANLFNPHLRLFGPDGSLIAQGFIATSGGRDAEISETTLTNTGTYILVVNSYYANGNGSYSLTLAHAPAPLTVSEGDEGGMATNGFQHSGTINVGDLDLWTFAGNAGNRVVLRMGANSFNPHLRLFGPTGVLMAKSFIATSGGRDAEIPSTLLTNTGNYTLIVNSYYPNASGDYVFTVAQSPGAFTVSTGDEGGPLTNGFHHTGALNVGDLDLWSFSANAGDRVVLRMGADSLNPRLRLFGPGGSLVAEAFIATSGGRDTEIPVTVLTNSGSYTVVASSHYANASGSYGLTLARFPGTFIVAADDQGGPLTNGYQHDGAINVGDLDLWSFSANAGDRVVLSTGANSFNPHLRLFGPSGSLIAESFISTSGGRDTEIQPTTLTNSGTYMLVINSYYANLSGAYILTLVQAPGQIEVAPGDEGGPLAVVGQQTGTVQVGDLDVWTGRACRGSLLELLCEELSGGNAFTPRMRVFGPDGVLLATAQNALLARAGLLMTNSGTILVIVDGAGLNHAGTYRLTVTGLLADGLRLCPPLISGEAMDVTGVGGVAGASAILIAATNVAAPIPSWTPVYTNTFDDLGNVLYTNLARPADAKRFFRLQQQ
ncbi:MAG TPA: PPC domain-containing protein [Clostridia bacterium]|nr:PPC domain-containing protein [Clostridia bacterium]